MTEAAFDLTQVAERPRLTLADAALMMREAAMRDRAYLDQTGLGPDVDRFLVYFRSELGKAEATCALYEYCLARFAVFYADLALEEFDGKQATNQIRDFMRETYADVMGHTWNTRLAAIKAFFRWAWQEDRIEYDPAAIIRYRKVPQSERQAHSPERIQRIVVAQEERRDRIAVQLLGRLGLRRNELRQVQFKHLNQDTRELTVFGKGGTVKPLPVPEDLFIQMRKEASERLASPDEFLLYPQKLGTLGIYPETRMGIIWEDRLSPLSTSGMDKWWRRVLKRAQIDHFPMHELRHSAGTNFWRETRDLRMTQKMMRHKKIGTTADVYLHDDVADLAEAIDSLPAWEVED